MDSTPEQIKNAIANLRANLKNGELFPTTRVEHWEKM